MSASLVIHNVAAFTGDDAASMQYGASILVTGSHIADLGPADLIAQRYPDVECFDASGHLAAPGFANCHTHLPRILARGIFEDQNQPNKPPYSRKGFLSFPRMSREERDVMVRLALLESIRSGATALMEVGSGLVEYAQILADSGMRIVLAEQFADRAPGERVGEPGKITFTSFDPAVLDARLQTLVDQFHGRDGRIKVAVAAHAPDMCSPDLLSQLIRLREAHGLSSTVHLNQYWGEVDAIRATFDCLPTEYLVREGFIDESVIAVHCRCMAPSEEELLGSKKASVCYTPAVTARAGNSARISALAEAGANIVLGSDEFAADMVEVMRLAVLLERVRKGESQTPTPTDAWRWATRAGYAALGFENGGVLRPGALADLILIDLRKAHLAPTIKAQSAFVHQGQASDVSSVMVNGEWLMKKGQVVVFDEQQVLSEAESVGRSVWRRALADRADVKRELDL